jgi:hypothetical protein
MPKATSHALGTGAEGDGDSSPVRPCVRARQTSFFDHLGGLHQQRRLLLRTSRREGPVLYGLGALHQAVLWSDEPRIVLGLGQFRLPQTSTLPVGAPADFAD